jgi:hypothetical protein
MDSRNILKETHRKMALSASDITSIAVLMSAILAELLFAFSTESFSGALPAFSEGFPEPFRCIFSREDLVLLTLRQAKAAKAGENRELLAGERKNVEVVKQSYCGCSSSSQSAMDWHLHRYLCRAIVFFTAILLIIDPRLCDAFLSTSNAPNGKVGLRKKFPGSLCSQPVPRDEDFNPDEEEAFLAISPGLPTLGHFVIAEAEPNLPAQPRQSRFSKLKATLGLSGLGNGNRGRRRKGLAAPAAGVGAAVGFMALGPFGAAIGAVMSALATKKDGPAGDAARMTAKAAGIRTF